MADGRTVGTIASLFAAAVLAIYGINYSEKNKTHYAGVPIGQQPAAQKDKIPIYDLIIESQSADNFSIRAIVDQNDRNGRVINIPCQYAGTSGSITSYLSSQRYELSSVARRALAGYRLGCRATLTPGF